jgi:hypothetical protein
VDNEVAPDVLSVGLETLPVPEITDQVPIPVDGKFPARKVELGQMIWSGPAFAVVGNDIRIIFTVSEVAGHTPLVLVHTIVFVPVVNPLISEVFNVEVVTVPPPVITDQVVEPIEGILAFRLAVVVVKQKDWSGPALTAEGKASTIIFTVLVEEGQVPLDITHSNEFVPVDKPVTDEVFRFGVVTELPPEITVHDPVPIDGTLEFKVAVEEQIVKSVPALEGVGLESTNTETVLVETGQTPLATDHSKMLFPVAKPVTPDEFNVGVVTEELPAITDQVPTPTIGALALKVVFGEQITWFKPAIDTVGNESTKIITVSVELGQVPFEVVQTRELTPLDNAITDDEFNVGVVIDDVPVLTDQMPVPIEGIFEFNVVDEAQIVKSVPALAGVGLVSTKTDIVFVEAGQAPFTIDHWRILFPNANPVTPEEFNVGVVIEEPPEITDHVPIPTTGTFAFNAA